LTPRKAKFSRCRAMLTKPAMRKMPPVGRPPISQEILHWKGACASPFPFALNLSKGRSPFRKEERRAFDKLRPNG